MGVSSLIEGLNLFGLKARCPVSIYEALGHRISVLERQNHRLKEENELAVKALEVVLQISKDVSKCDPTLAERWSHVVDLARRAVELSRHQM